MNTADYLLENGKSNQPAIIAGRTVYTYADLRKACARLAGEMISCGLAQGDRVGILGSNSLFWAAAYIAAMKLGAIAVPFATTLTSEDVTGMAEFVKCRVICSERRMLRTFSDFLNSRIVIYDDVLQQPGHEDWPDAACISSLDENAALMFTSGTTARPRLVQVTHGNIQANTDSIIEYLELDENERILAVLQFFYCFGTSLLHSHLRVGGAIVLATSFVYPEVVLNLLEEMECTGFAGVPSTYQTLLRNSTFPKRKLNGLRKLQQAGGKLQNVLIEELVKATPQAKVYVMYGQTEATARLSYLSPDLLEKKLGSIGKGIPGVNLRVEDEEGHLVKPGEVGEIVARGENISPGYWHDPEASQGKFVNGSLRTGDLATIDEDGFIYVVDRKADFIKSFGHRVSSQRVEECILELSDVVGAAVIGEPDLVRGEAIWAFVVRCAGSELSKEQIIAHCAGRMANYYVPKEVIFLDQLPMNAHGKFVKNELRKLAGRAVESGLDSNS
jgi:long-chain acyl-CoA synthetase